MTEIPPTLQNFVDKHRALGHAVYFGRNYVVARDEVDYAREYERIPCPNAYDYALRFINQEKDNGDEENRDNTNTD